MIKLPIVGAKFRPPAQEVLALLPAGAELLLRRQPDNPHDGNAVQVLLPISESLSEDIINELDAAGVDLDTETLHLGYIPRADSNLPTDAARLAPLMDRIIYEEDDVPGSADTDIKGALTFGPSGNPMIVFEEPK
jgi:hypothetical protein